MGRTKESKRKLKGEKSILNRLTPARPTHAKPKPQETPSSLLERATTLLQTSQPDEALEVALRALALVQQPQSPPEAALAALNTIAEIHVELGDIVTAREYFSRAVDIDPDGLVPEDAGGGAEKFLWLAQLCEDGGMTSVEWFEKGVTVLRKQLGELENIGSNDNAMLREEKRTKLANALCGAAEVFMTDLSWEEDAESRCESLVTEALLVSPNSPEPLQTLASIRISQLRLEDAKVALTRSMELWKDLPPEDARIPAYPTRISLVRLLLESEMEDEALEVVERLVSEDDQSVEGWYLGGWTLYLMGDKRRRNAAASSKAEEPAEWTTLWKSSKDWLENALKLYRALDYEDDKLRDHATELVDTLGREVGNMEGADSDADDAEDSNWEDASDDDDDGDDDDDDHGGETIDKEMTDA